MVLKIKPSARQRNRYLLLEGKKEKVEEVILEYLGILGWTKINPKFVSNVGKRVILSVNRKSLNDVRAAFAISKADIKVLKVSGTLKGLR